ncbi:hypothetical protein GQ457_13G011530 [Hibiscus cannabinus]
MADPIESSASTSDPNPIVIPITLLHPRRVPFEHGLLPIQRLIFTDPVQALAPLKQKLSSSSTRRVDSPSLADALQISSDHARLILDTLASVLHSESDPLVNARPEDVDSVGADLRDLMLFLYIQSYKRLLPRSHKDSASVADVWPSTSAFDGFLSALSPLQLVRSNTRRFMPSQADEEAHQLSYLQKHLANILTLLSEPVEGEGEDSQVLTMEGFEHLGFLIQFGDKGSEGIPLSQAAPFFANSDPDMPAVPVPASQVHDWLLENIAASLEHVIEKVSAKENGPQGGSDQDVAMPDASSCSAKASQSTRNICFIEGVSKSSYVKQASDLKHSSVKVINCHDSVIYILAPLRYATIYGCSDATIVLGAVGKAVRVEHCERVHVIVAAKRVCIANCRECLFFLGVNQRPLIVGDNHKLQVAPYNTFYSQLEEHMTEVGIKATINKWDEPLALGAVDPHDSLSHPAGVSDAQAESAAHLDSDQFTNFLIPNWFEGESTGSTKDNPFPLPDAYLTSQQRNQKNLGEIKQILREAPLEENRKREVSCALHVYFKDWLYASGNIRQLYCLQVSQNVNFVLEQCSEKPFETLAPILDANQNHDSITNGSFGPWMIVAQRPHRNIRAQNDSTKSNPIQVQGSRFNPILVAETNEVLVLSTGNNLPPSPLTQQARKLPIPLAHKANSKKKMIASSNTSKAPVMRKPLMVILSNFLVLSRFASKAFNSRSNPNANQGISVDKTRHSTTVMQENDDPNVVNARKRKMSSNWLTKEKTHV